MCCLGRVDSFGSGIRAALRSAIQHKTAAVGEELCAKARVGVSQLSVRPNQRILAAPGHRCQMREDAATQHNRDGWIQEAANLIETLLQGQGAVLLIAPGVAARARAAAAVTLLHTRGVPNMHRLRFADITYPARQMHQAGTEFPFARFGAAITAEFERFATVDLGWLMTQLAGTVIAIPYIDLQSGFCLGVMILPHFPHMQGVFGAYG